MARVQRKTDAKTLSTHLHVLCTIQTSLLCCNRNDIYKRLGLVLIVDLDTTCPYVSAYPGQDKREGCILFMIREMGWSAGRTYKQKKKKKKKKKGPIPNISNLEGSDTSKLQSPILLNESILTTSEAAEESVGVSGMR